MQKLSKHNIGKYYRLKYFILGVKLLLIDYYS